MNLSVELDPDDQVLHPQDGIHRHGSRNGPARQRRRQKRAAAREVAKEVPAEATDDGKVKEIAEEATVDVTGEDIVEEATIKDRSTTTGDVVDDLVDEFCSDEEYLKEVEETFEMFKLTYKCLPYESGKSEKEILEDMKRNLSYTFNYYRVKKEDQYFKFVKSEKINDCLKILLKVKAIPEVLQSAQALKTWKTDVRQMPKMTTFHPSTFSQ